MTPANQSRIVALLGHHPNISAAEPFQDPDEDAVSATVEGVLSIGGLNRHLPDGWHASNVSATRGTTEVHVFPRR